MAESLTLLLSVILGLFVTGTQGYSYCYDSSTGYTQYCSNDCCGSYGNRYCCTNVASIIGGVIGTVIFVAIIIAVCCCLRRRRLNQGTLVYTGQPGVATVTTVGGVQQAGYPYQPGVAQAQNAYPGQPGMPQAGYYPQPTMPQAGYQPQPQAGYQPQPTAGYQPQATGQNFQQYDNPGMSKDAMQASAPPSYDAVVQQGNQTSNDKAGYRTPDWN